MSVPMLKNLGLLAIAFGAVLVALSPRRRALIARTLARRHRFVSRRIVDRDARYGQALDMWDDDGGASAEGAIHAAIR
jgi:hypothetical protein